MGQLFLEKQPDLIKWGGENVDCVYVGYEYVWPNKPVLITYNLYVDDELIDSIITNRENKTYQIPSAYKILAQLTIDNPGRLTIKLVNDWTYRNQIYTIVFSSDAGYNHEILWQPSNVILLVFASTIPLNELGTNITVDIYTKLTYVVQEMILIYHPDSSNPHADEYPFGHYTYDCEHRGYDGPLVEQTKVTEYALRQCKYVDNHDGTWTIQFSKLVSNPKYKFMELTVQANGRGQVVYKSTTSETAAFTINTRDLDYPDSLGIYSYKLDITLKIYEPA